MNRPNIPDQIDVREKDYSFRADMKVNGWMFVALVISVASEIYSSEIRTGLAYWRVLIVIIPFLAILAWVRDLFLWIRDMDELHRRITFSTIVFAVSATLFISTLWELLAKTGIWHHFFANFFDPSSLWIKLSLLTAFYFHGSRFFNRRYQ